MTQRLEIWYMRSLYDHQLIPEKLYQYSENKCRFCGKNWNFYKDGHVEISVNIICDLTRRSRRVDFAGGETGTSLCGSLYIARFFLTRNLFFRLAAPPVCICTELSTFLGCRFSINTEFLVFALLCRSFDSFVILGSSTKIYCLFCLNLGIAQFLVSLLKIAPFFCSKNYMCSAIGGCGAIYGVQVIGTK